MWDCMSFPCVWVLWASGPRFPDYTGEVSDMDMTDLQADGAQDTEKLGRESPSPKDEPPYGGHYSVTGKLSHSTTTTPAPEPFYDSDGIPLPDELFAGLEPASSRQSVATERSDPVLLWHGDGDECTGIHCGNPEHGWTELAPAYVECPSCDDASAAHIAGLHEEPAPAPLDRPKASQDVDSGD